MVAGLPIQFEVEAVSPASLLPSHSGRVTPTPLPSPLPSCEPSTHNTDSPQGLKAITVNSFIPVEDEENYSGDWRSSGLDGHRHTQTISVIPTTVAVSESLTPNLYWFLPLISVRFALSNFEYLWEGGDWKRTIAASVNSNAYRISHLCNDVKNNGNERDLFIVVTNRKFLWRQAWIVNIFWFLLNIGLAISMRSSNTMTTDLIWRGDL